MGFYFKTNEYLKKHKLNDDSVNQLNNKAIFLDLTKVDKMIESVILINYSQIIDLIDLCEFSSDQK